MTAGAAVSPAERLDALPPGGFHRRLVALAGLGWMFDAMDVALVSFVLPVLAAAWGLTSWQIGWTASMTLIGMLFGAVASGEIADRWGRRAAFMGTLVLFGAASALCGLAPGYRTFLAMRFLVGLGLGGELPVAAAYVAEFSPRLHRGKLVIFLDTFWSFGWALAAVLAYVLVPRWGWRAVFFAGGLPALYALVLRRGLPESPRFLTSRGRHAEAEAVVRAVESECGVPPAPLRAQAAAAETPGGLRDLWRGPAARQTAMLWTLWFVMGYTYFGIYSWLPTLLVASGHTLVKSFGYSLLIALAQAPGFASAALCVERWGRVATLTFYRLMLAVACFFFGYAAVTPGRIMFWGAMISFFGMGSWGVAYAYTAESYSTRLRATAGGWATGMARVGGILAPLSIGWIMSATGSQRLVFWSMTGITLVGVVAVLALGRETRGQSLEESSAV